MKLLKKSFLLIVITLKSIFRATTEIIWGMVSFLALGIGLFYLHEKDYLDEFGYTTINEPLIMIYGLIVDHLGLFWLVFLIWYFYLSWKEVKE